jgi:hypothetical protein
LRRIVAPQHCSVRRLVFIRNGSNSPFTDVVSNRWKGMTMEIGGLLLNFGTLGFVVAFGYISARATEKYRQSNPPKSALSRDGIEERIRAKVAIK